MSYPLQDSWEGYRRASHSCSNSALVSSGSSMAVQVAKLDLKGTTQLSDGMKRSLGGRRRGF